MLLQDATASAAVHLYGRSLQFPFSRNSVVGIPGNVIGFSSRPPDELATLLVHELQHVHTLTYPLGVVLTAIGLRTLELHQRAAASFNDWERIVKSETPEAADRVAGEAIAAARRAARFGLLARETAELLSPLLEGLAMLAEMEVDGHDASMAWDMAVSIEMFQIEYAMRVQAREFTKDSRTAARADVAHALQRQLDYGREKRRTDVFDRMFLRDSYDGDAAATTPYFFGYLFMRRLYQQWKLQIPDLGFGQFFADASRACCETVPLTLLPYYSFDVAYAADQLHGIFREALRRLLSFSRVDIERLQNDHSLLRLGLEGFDVMSPEGKPLEGSLVLNWTRWFIFDIVETESADFKEVVEDLAKCEFTKFLSPTERVPVWVLGVEEDSRSLVVIDPGKITRETELAVGVGFDGGILVPLANEAEFAFFMSAVRDRDQPLSRVIRRDGRVVISAPKRVVKGTLAVYTLFWPDGVPTTEFRELNPADLVLALEVPFEEGGDEVFRSIGGRVDPQRANELIDWRARLTEVSDQIDAAMASDLKGVKYALGCLFTAKVEGAAAAGEVADALTDDWAEAMRKRCQGVYVEVLFSDGLSIDRVSSDKLAVLKPDLSLEDFNSLRRWLRLGAVLDSRRAYVPATPLDSDVSAAVDRVRTVARRTLGIPLIALKDGAITLDLIP